MMGRAIGDQVDLSSGKGIIATRKNPALNESGMVMSRRQLSA
jgi:hypothetical protein